MSKMKGEGEAVISRPLIISNVCLTLYHTVQTFNSLEGKAFENMLGKRTKFSLFSHDVFYLSQDEITMFFSFPKRNSFLRNISSSAGASDLDNSKISSFRKELTLSET